MATGVVMTTGVARMRPAPTAVVAAMMLAVAAVTAGCVAAPKPMTGPGAAGARASTIPGWLVEPTVDPVVLEHLLRGLHFLAVGHPGAAVPDLQFALAADPLSPFLYEKLSVAWDAAGNRAQAQSVLVAGLSACPTAPALNLLSGELAMADNHFADAIMALEHAVADETLLARAGTELLDALLWTHQVQKAEARALELARRAPSDATLAMVLASVLEDHGRLETALSLYRQAGRQRPSDAALALAEARVLGLQGRFQAAAQALVPMFQFYPDQLTYYLEIARLWRRAHSVESETYRAEAERLTAGDPDGRLQLAALDLDSGHRDAGVAVLREAVRAWPLRLDLRLLLAEALANADDPAHCAEILDVSFVGPAALHRRRASCLAATGTWAGMQGELEQAVRLGSARDELTAAAGIVARYATDEAQAHTGLDELVARLGGRVATDDVLLAEVVVLDYFGHVEALALLLRLSPEVKGELDLLLRYVDLASRYGEGDQALVVLEPLVQRNPQNPVALNALGFGLADAGIRLDEAEVWLRRAYRLAPYQSFIIDSLGWLLYRRGDLAGAARLLEQARDLDPGDAEILRHLGDVYRARGQPGAARTCFERALLLRPAIPLRTLLRARLSGAAS